MWDAEQERILYIVSIPFIGSGIPQGTPFSARTTTGFEGCDYTGVEKKAKPPCKFVQKIAQTRMYIEPPGSIFQQSATKPVSARVKGSFFTSFFHFVRPPRILDFTGRNVSLIITFLCFSIKEKNKGDGLYLSITRETQGYI